MCIFYGHNLWFQAVGTSKNATNESNAPEDGWGGLSQIGQEENPFLQGDRNELIPEEDLPIIRTKIAPNEEEDVSDTISTSEFTLLLF